jgi:hypothetical protein
MPDDDYFLAAGFSPEQAEALATTFAAELDRTARTYANLRQTDVLIWSGGCQCYRVTPRP